MAGLRPVTAPITAPAGHARDQRRTARRVALAALLLLAGAAAAGVASRLDEPEWAGRALGVTGLVLLVAGSALGLAWCARRSAAARARRGNHPGAWPAHLRADPTARRAIEVGHDPVGLDRPALEPAPLDEARSELPVRAAVLRIDAISPPAASREPGRTARRRPPARRSRRR